MNDVQEKFIALVDEIGSQSKVARLIKSETDFNMPQSTISRLYRGQAKPAMYYLTVYVLKHAIKKEVQNEKD